MKYNIQHLVNQIKDNTRMRNIVIPYKINEAYAKILENPIDFSKTALLNSELFETHNDSGL